MPLESGVQFTADSGVREWRMWVLRKAIEVIVWPLHKCELKKFLVKNRELVECNSVPPLVPHYYGISETKDVSAGRQSVAVIRPCVRLMVTDAWKLSLSILPSFLKTFIGLRRVQGMSCYMVFTFETLHILHLWIFKLSKQWTVNYIALGRLRTEVVWREGKSFVKIRLLVLLGAICFSVVLNLTGSRQELV